METCEQRIFPGFEDTLQCSAQASPASQLPWPGSAEARAMTAGSGRQCSLVLEQSSPLGAFSKILLESSLWTNSGEYSYVWKRLDTKFALSAFQLTPLEPNISDTESSLWRTPNASMVSGGGMDGSKRLESGHAMQLSDQVLSPKLWPTPTVPNGGRRNPEGTSITGKKPDGGKAQIDLREFAIRSGTESYGSLNPRFVEELLGFAIDHTALKPSATQLSRNRPIRSLKRS